MGQWFNGPGEDLATLARETGYPVVEVDGWQQRGHGPLADHVGVVVCHHTASCEPHETSSNAPALDVVTHGRAGLDGPLSHYVLGYDGTIYVVAAGNAWHAGSGGWRGMSGNEVALGIEAEDAGDGDWTAAQLDAYPRLVARICQFLGITEAGVCGHKEWTPRKPDPAGIDMDDFRRQVAGYLAHPHTIDRAQHGPAPAPPTTPQEDDDMRLTDPVPVPSQAEQGTVGYALHNLLYGVDGVRRDGDIAAALRHMTWRLDSMATTIPTLIAQQGHDPQQLAEALRPIIGDVVGPVVEQAVTNALGQDNADQADAIVDAIAAELAGGTRHD